MSATRSPGRPRDESVTRAILNAAIEILADKGVDQMTVEAVARRAGVSRPSVYSRWPTLGALVFDSVLESRRRFQEAHAQDVPFPVPDTGSLAGDLAALVEQGIALFAGLEQSGVIQALLIESIRSESIARRFEETILASDERLLTTIFARASERGEWPVADDGQSLDARLALRSLIALALVERYVLHAPFEALGSHRLAEILGRSRASDG